MRTISPLECDVRHEVYLAATLDPFSVGRLTGLPDLAGARCLELGAGGSAVPVWLADRVGPMGEVVAAGATRAGWPRTRGSGPWPTTRASTRCRPGRSG
ncbi:hypothetical protein [Phytohabitans rumicis]|uniref:Methyltransferase type 11 domain-containing protein n=1 Tax=Phytohabitans rumicis TaxID=1076125 RepID=A0A6V8L193_9ACTN|nr:hypothetical protein [Phytohabitans rumicis]GFJ88571.1 hypothetical protein Prum_022130 [Phytohabitans rumicis]